MKYGPRSLASQQVFRERYTLRGEDFRDVCNRVAATLCPDGREYHAFRDLLLEQKFLTGGRITAGAGSSRKVCLHNCFVSGTISDSFVDGQGSIMHRAAEAAATMRMGGGIGYDFSTLRPRNDLIKSLESFASGPVSFMHIYDAVGVCTASAGNRRGAQMGMLRVDHPDILEFINAKKDETTLTNFNISVAVTDEFMRAVESDGNFDLRFQDRVYQTVKARDLWEALMRNAWDWAEPGVIFIDRINAMNNLGYREYIAATNPCSEQPLPPFGACLLGSVNLVQYVGRWEQLERDVALAVRALDRVNDLAQYPLVDQRVEATAKRRMGIGVTGLANALEVEGAPYGSPAFISKMHTVLSRIRDAAYSASVELAKTEGTFPLYQEDYLNQPFIRTLPSALRDDIKRHGIRNSHLLSIAPTGTISFCADNISSGIEPVHQYEEERLVNTREGPRMVSVKDYGVEYLGWKGKLTQDVTVEEHLKVLCTAQQYVDSAVAKTCNVPPTMEWNDFKDLYFRAWRMGAKGCSVFNTGGKRAGVRGQGAECATGTCDM